MVLFDAAETVEELLGCTERCVVQFLDAIQQPKAYAKLCVQGLCIVANNFKPTAFGWPLRSKRANEHIPTRLYRGCYLANVGGTLVLTCPVSGLIRRLVVFSASNPTSQARF